MFSMKYIADNLRKLYQDMESLSREVDRRYGEANTPAEQPMADVIRQSIANPQPLYDPAQWFERHLGTEADSSVVATRIAADAPLPSAVPLEIDGNDGSPSIVYDSVDDAISEMDELPAIQNRADAIPAARDRSRSPLVIREGLEWTDHETNELRRLKGLGHSNREIGNILQRPEQKVKNRWSYIRYIEKNARELGR